MKRLILILAIMATLAFSGCGHKYIRVDTVIIDIKARENSISVSPAKVKVEKPKDATIVVPIRYDSTAVDISIIYPDKETTDADTKLKYSPVLSGKSFVFQRDDKSIVIMENSDLPDRWEFDLKFEPKEQGFVGVAAMQRWLITAR